MRHEKRISKNYQIAYGQDHACGLFLQVYDDRLEDNDDEGLVFDEDAFLDGLTQEKMDEVIEKYKKLDNE